MPRKTAIISVINDLVTDQRIARTADVLTECGFTVVMVGRQKYDSLRMPDRTYETIRMRLLWEKGPFFYIEYNLRLFFFLLLRPCSLLFSNDLDTLLPNFMISKMRRIPMVFDSHEYFTETPELINRPFIKNIWKGIERLIVPSLKECITVNESIASLFKQEYGKEFHVVRNIPTVRTGNCPVSRKELNLPADKKIILLQGAGINIQRGAEEAVEAMQYLDDFLLLIIGGGDVLPFLKEQVETLNLHEKVWFIPKQKPDKLLDYTRSADLGITLDKDTNLNYRYSLPNKLFDYIHAGIPVLASPLPEIRKIVELYDVGSFIESHEPQHIASKIKEMLTDKAACKRWKDNLVRAQKELQWENEKQVLISILKPYA